jgi:hypothetical protein
MMTEPSGHDDANVNEPSLRRQEEWDWWDKHREELIACYGGRWIVIHGTKVTGSADSYAEALAAGYEAHGLDPFLVQFVAVFDPVAMIII